MVCAERDGGDGFAVRPWQRAAALAFRGRASRRRQLCRRGTGRSERRRSCRAASRTRSRSAGCRSRRRSASPRTAGSSSPRRAAWSRCSTACATRRRRRSPTSARDRRLLGPRLARSGARPGLPGDAVRLRALRVRRIRLGAPAPRWSDSCPTPPGPTDGRLRDQRPARRGCSSAATRSPRTTVLIEDWCQQYPSHSVGNLAFGPDGALYVSARRRRELQLRRLRPGRATRSTRAATRRAAPAGRRRRRPLRAARCAARTCGRPATRTGLDGRSCGSIPTPAPAMPDNPNVGSAERERPADRRLRLPQPVPVHRPARHERDLGRRRRLGHVGGDRPRPEPDGRDDRTSAGRATRATAARPATTAPTSTSARTCTRRPARGHGAVLRVQPRGRTSCPATPARRRRLVDHRSRVLRRRPYPAAYNGALFFADYSRNCIWAMMPGVERPARPDEHPDVRRRPAGPVDLEVGPNGDLYYVDFDGGTIHRLALPERDVLDRQLPRRLLQQPDPHRLAGAQPLRDRNRLLVGRQAARIRRSTRTTSPPAGPATSRSLQARTSSRPRPTTACGSGSTARR